MKIQKIIEVLASENTVLSEYIWVKIDINAYLWQVKQNGYYNLGHWNVKK